MADRQLDDPDVHRLASSPCFADEFAVEEPIVFYNHPISNFGAKVAIVLRHKGLACDQRLPPDGYGSAAYKAIVPAGTIPALVDGGLVLSESETINEYLDEAYPEPSMLPGLVADRARIRLLARFHDQRLEPPLRALFPHMSPRLRDERQVTAQIDLFNERLAQLDVLAFPRPYMGGEVLTLADCAFPATLLLAEMMLAALGRTLPLSERLIAWRELVGRHPSVEPVLADTEVAYRDWLARRQADA